MKKLALLLISLLGTLAHPKKHNHQREDPRYVAFIPPLLYNYEAEWLYYGFDFFSQEVDSQPVKQREMKSSDLNMSYRVEDSGIRLNNYAAKEMIYFRDNECSKFIASGSVKEEIKTQYQYMEYQGLSYLPWI